MRRLLENGANTSFINRLADDEAPVSEIIRDPVEIAEAERGGAAERQRPFVRPRDIYLPERAAASGLALSESAVRHELFTEMGDALDDVYEAGPIVGGTATTGGDSASLVTCPHDRRERIGTVRITTAAQADAAIGRAVKAEPDWNKQGGAKRAQILAAAADLFERDKARLMAVIVREAGKTLEDAQGDVREAIDFLRYYAAQARRLFAGPVALPGPTGERNTLTLNGRGVFACISPWNFPLAIFTGQVAAALAAGNAVLAKPAGQTPITAFLATKLLHEAGVPGNVLHLLPGSGRLGELLVKDTRISGISFTGSNETAWAIQKALADRRNAIVPFIAETGGLNAMIADSSALPEQVVRDTVRSAFNSAGQRCSAARVLFVQADIADKVIAMLSGAMDEIVVGDPSLLSTDVGPVFDAEALAVLKAHAERMDKQAKLIKAVALPDACAHGSFFAPRAYEIGALSELTQEVFGPVLHVLRYDARDLDKVLADINATGYGLTLGIHSRIDATVQHIVRSVRVGNCYVNRNQIGAVVGVQPFGGEGLSGTGPKAGGPHYLLKFASERTLTVNTTAAGGNASLLTLAE